MQDKYELRITLTNSTAINILKNLDNYGLRRKIIECAIIKFAKSIWNTRFPTSKKRERTNKS